MSEIVETPIESKTPEMVDVQKPLAKAYDMLSEANTVLIEKDIYKPEHLQKKLGELYQSIEEGTGIAHPSRIEAETLRKDLEASKASLDASKGELEALAKFKAETETKLKDLEASKVELESQLAKFKDAKFGKFDDTEGTTKVEEHKAKYHDLLKYNPLEAARYYDKNISSLAKSKKQ
jgi:chromosome segregation ATPase